MLKIFCVFNFVHFDECKILLTTKISQIVVWLVLVIKVVLRRFSNMIVKCGGYFWLVAGPGMAEGVLVEQEPPDGLGRVLEQHLCQYKCIGWQRWTLHQFNTVRNSQIAKERLFTLLPFGQFLPIFSFPIFLHHLFESSFLFYGQTKPKLTCQQILIRCHIYRNRQNQRN